MTSRLEILPSELFLRIIEQLDHGDLSRLVAVSHGCHNIVAPILWATIELHRPGQMRNENRGEDAGDSDDAEDSDADEHYSQDRSQQFLDNFEMHLRYNDNCSPRAPILARRVRWLCITVGASRGGEDGKLDSWNVLASFTNLQYLELSAQWVRPECYMPFNAPEQPMKKLRTLKLKGYVPAEVVDYFTRNADMVTELQLALLDAPIGSALCDERENPPPPSRYYPEDYDGMSEEDLVATDEEDDFDDEEIVAARPLACLSQATLSKFTNLRTLSLCRPSQADDSGSYSMHDMYISVGADKRILHEWATLIENSRGSLTHLGLDQRPLAPEIESDSTGNNEFMMYYMNGPGYLRFVDIVLPVLLAEEAKWPHLQSIHLFGFELEHGLKLKDHIPQRGHRHTSVDIEAKLRARFPDIQVVNRLGKRILMDDDSGEIHGLLRFGVRNKPPL